MLMAQAFAIRRAAVYRARAHELGEAAAREWQEDRRRHMLDQAATFQRAADQMAPAPEPTEREKAGLFRPSGWRPRS